MDVICRVWHGWTAPQDADAYETLLKEEIFVGIGGRQIEGYRGIHLLRRALADEVEFVTVMWFDGLDAVRAFAGEEYEKAVVPPRARALLSRFDARSQHYQVRAEVPTPPEGETASAAGAPGQTAGPRVYRVVTAHRSPYPNPLVLSKGEELAVGDKETPWTGWIWCTDRAGKSGWVPEAYVARRGETGIMLRDYDATELSADVGEELAASQEESGWIWCTNRAGRTGWVPLDNVEEPQ